MTREVSRPPDPDDEWRMWLTIILFVVILPWWIWGVWQAVFYR